MNRKIIITKSPERAQTVLKTTVDGGLRILSENIPGLRSIAVGVWIDAGSQDETDEKSGIAHFIEHAVFKGTKRRKTHQIALYLESVGGFLNAFTTKEHTCYYARVRDEHLTRAIDLLTDLVLNPIFPEHEIEKEKQVIIEEMRSAEDEPDEIIHDYFERQLFEPHPLGRFIIGTERSVQSITPSDLRKFCRDNYTKNNLIIIAVGNVDHDRLVDMVSGIFESAPPGVEKNHSPGIPKKKPSFERIEKSFQQTHICSGRTIPGVHNPHSYSMAILNTLVGEGMSSRLFQTVREKYGYAYSVFSFLSLMKEVGVFGIYAGTDAGNSMKCFDLIRDVLDQLYSDSISKRELNRTKEQMKGNLLLGLESTTARMTHIARGELYFGKQESIEEMLQRIDAVTIEEIAGVSSMLCDVEKYSTTIISNH